MSYSAEITADAEQHLALGAEYFAARESVERYVAKFQEEHAEHLAEAIMKPVLDAVHDKVWDSFREHLLSDTEQNMQTEMRRMVENSVRALLGGERWANVKYIEYPHREGQKVRETLAKLHSDPIKDGRIADLEAEVKRLTEQLEYLRRY